MFLAVTGAVVLLAVSACSSADTSAPTTAASPTSAPDVVTTDGGFVIGGYRVTAVEPGATGLAVPPDLEGVTGYRYFKDADEVAVAVQGLLPESVSPNDENLQRVLAEAAGGGSATAIEIGEQRGFVIEGPGGEVYIGNLLEDGTVNVVKGRDRDALVAMLVALNQATSSAQ